MSETDGIIFALRLDEQGGASELDGESVHSWKPDEGILWLHLDAAHDVTRTYLEQHSGVAEWVVEALLADETRPRSMTTRNALLLIVRGVNLHPGAEPDDMIAVRMLIEPRRVITLRRRRPLAIQDVRDALARGDGPQSSGELLVSLTDAMVSRMAGVMAEIDDEVDALEDEVLTKESYELRGKIGAIRRDAIGLRRYLAPQRDVMARLHTEKLDWLGDTDRAYLREIADRTTRYVEDLDSARDRAAVAQDELNNRLAEQMNKTMYVLSIVAAIFLPLGLLTGLLGINVGGMPGVDSRWAFLIVCAILAVTAVFQTWFFRRMRWL